VTQFDKRCEHQAGAAASSGSESPLQAYLALLDSGCEVDADQFLIKHLAAIGYGKVVWHLWRFRRFAGLEPIRASLLDEFQAGVDLPWNALQLLYYLQEARSTGQPESDVSLHCPAIFKALCRSLSGSVAKRRQALQLYLVWQGLVDRDNELSLPAATDEDVALLFDPLSELDRLLMECGRYNRANDHPVALSLAECGQLRWSDAVDPSKLVEVYIGPYYFLPLSADQRQRAKLPDSFHSPFRSGLECLIRMFLNHGWQVMPWLTWAGGLIPPCAPRGRLSFSYHTHGGAPGRWHYKFGHFSNLMQIDPQGYAGFSSLASADAREILTATTGLDDAAIASALDVYREIYLTRRVTWRAQRVDASPSLERGRRTIFVPLQDPFDEVATLAYLTPSEMLRGIACAVGPQDRVYVKRHPVDASGRTSALLATLANDPRFVVTDASIHDLFETSDLVVTINSGVGFEALLAGLPVITCGGADYHLATGVARRTEELTKLVQASSWPALAWRSRVVYHYLAQHVFDPADPVAFEEKLVQRLGPALDWAHDYNPRPDGN
jgi:hypothetical protein